MNNLVGSENKVELNIGQSSMYSRKGKGMIRAKVQYSKAYAIGEQNRNID